MKKLVSIVIPCFNEEEGLAELYKQVEILVSNWHYDYEVICVDDGSADGTWEVLEAFSEGNSRWKTIRLSRNFGHQPAVSAGMFKSRGDCVCVMDADLQDPPEVLNLFLKRWEEGYEVAYGVRKSREDKGLKKLFAWGFYRVLSKLSTIKIPRDAGDFCLLDKKVVSVMNSLPERNRYLRGLRAWCGFEHAEVEFDRGARSFGEPQYTFRKSLRLALDGIFSFSAVPLSVASHMGLWISVTAFIGAIFTFFQRIFPDFFAQFGMAPGPGFTTIVISILFLGGIQLICLGVLGEYLGRIYDEVKGRPNWVISESNNLEKDGE